MRDVRDWNKYVDMVGKSVSKRTAASSAAPAAVGQRDEASTDIKSFPAPPRLGRRPRKDETREELLSRLLDPTISLEETARILDVCPTTVRRYTNKGILPHSRSAGNQRRFKLSTVLKFDAQLRAGRSPEGVPDQ